MNTKITVVIVFLVIVLAALLFWKKDTFFASNTATSTPSTVVATSTTPSAPVVVRETRATADITSVIASIPEASHFAALFASTGVQAGLSATGSYTVFVPTNSAFGLLADEELTGLSSVQKKRLVQYHVVSGKKLDVDALQNGNATALSKDMLNFQVLPGGQSVLVNSSYVLKAYNTKNGIVYLINGVLLPPETE